MLPRFTSLRAAAMVLVLSLAVGPSSRADVRATDFAASAKAAHAMLTRLCDDFGGRLTGSTANAKAMAQLEHELADIGVKSERVPFTMRGWERGDDRVELIAPLARHLRVAALAYTQPCAPFEAEIGFIGGGKEEEFPVNMTGKIALLSSSSAEQMRVLAARAHEHGVRGILFTDREGGGQLLARTGSFVGEPLPMPVFSVTQEEGRWIERLLQRGQTIRAKMSTTSHCRPVETANLVARFPGKSASRVIVGAHFDSWDLGQGALDNGLGIAELFALAHALRGQVLERGVELVWFNGEEQGLWGSRYAAQHLSADPIIAMINLDMVGVPIAVNALGDASLVSALERWNTGRGARKLPRGVENINWFGSDHTPYQIAGVRAVTFNAPIPRDSVRYYHDLADTIDKLPEQLVIDSTAIIGDLVGALLQDDTVNGFLRSEPGETEKLFTTFGLERRMKAVGYWPFP